MSDLHPEARALIDAAKRGETPLSTAARARVRTSVARRTVAFGAALASTTSASVAAKGGVLATVLASPLVSVGVVGVVGGLSLFVARSLWMAPVAPPALVRPVASYVGVHLGGRPSDERSAPRNPTPQIAGSGVAKGMEGPAAPTVSASASATAFVPAVRRLDRAVAPRLDPPGVARERDLGPVAESPVGPSSAASSSLAGATTAVPVQPVGSTRDLATALDVLHRAHAALRAGQPERALELLSASAAVLDAGPFAEEAQAARASALCQTGRTQEARAALDHFLSSWPLSPLATRLRDGCGAVGGIGRTPAK